MKIRLKYEQEPIEVDGRWYNNEVFCGYYRINDGGVTVWFPKEDVAEADPLII